MNLTHELRPRIGHTKENVRQNHDGGHSETILMLVCLQRRVIVGIQHLQLLPDSTLFFVTATYRFDRCEICFVAHGEYRILPVM